VVQGARHRAQATLTAARQRSDSTHPSGSWTHAEVKATRAAEDAAFAGASVALGERVDAERDARERALLALLQAEREATDDGLLIERARADEAVAARDDFLGMVSHDLRTMLGGIALSAELLKGELHGASIAAPEALRHAERIQRFTGRMSHLLGDLLDVVSLDAGTLRVTPARRDAVVLTHEALESFQQSFAAKGITLSASLPAAPLLALFDHDRMLQVLTNLMGNALKFTERGGDVQLRVAHQDANVCFSVADNGPGIPAEESTRIFDRFRKVGPDRRGLGLGLYIAKSIVDAHAGKIWAESPPGGGTVMCFTLPAA
jgi:signal transduction histidine kinase